MHKNNTILWSFCSASLMRYFCQTSFDLNRFRLSFFKPPPWPPEKEYLNLYTSKSKWGYIYIFCVLYMLDFSLSRLEWVRERRVSELVRLILDFSPKFYRSIHTYIYIYVCVNILYIKVKMRGKDVYACFLEENTCFETLFCPGWN